jgi:hypothetical protein
MRDLCDLYQVTDTAERDRLMTLAREGKQRAWWQEYGLPYGPYVGLEAEAASIKDYNSDVVTGLLQIEGYARALLQAAEPPLKPEAVEQRVEARLKRQALLARDGGSPRFHCILDEVALHRHVGGSAVMRAQLAHIIETAALPNVTFQLVPLDSGAHPAMDSTFVIMEFGEPTVNDVVYVEGLVGNIYLEATTELERYNRVFSLLSNIAASPDESIALLSSIAGSYG